MHPRPSAPTSRKQNGSVRSHSFVDAQATSRIVAPRQCGRRRFIAHGRRIDETHTRRREQQPEPGALSGLALDAQLTAMALHDVLDDRQSQTGAAGVPRAAPIDAIEALGQSRQVLARDAGSVVDDRDLAAVVRQPSPLQFDAPPSGV